MLSPLLTRLRLPSIEPPVAAFEDARPLHDPIRVESEPGVQVVVTPAGDGVRIREVVDASPAEAAGLRDPLPEPHYARERGDDAEAVGARRETLMGLSGLGDLVLTATSMS